MKSRFHFLMEDHLLFEADPKLGENIGRAVKKIMVLNQNMIKKQERIRRELYL